MIIINFFVIKKEYTITKIIHNNIGEYLNPRAIAIWIMDDGSRQNSDIYLHTNSFTLKENMVLQKVFLEKYI